ncbi:MAG TPA: FAD-dependent oxidoreductase [Bryobacteraceae bacterium]|nr:FAD-dependent oxidoreductase [Bryobacteraceae bacterium]
MHTRRSFLGWMAAAPLAAQVSLRPVEPLERKGSAQRVIVLGAGLAGLCAAYELQTQGHQITVLESQSRPGGRVRTLRECFAPGLYAEAGPETIPGSHELTQHYARTFGLNLIPTAVPGTHSIYHVQGRRIVPDEHADWPFELTAEERRLGYAGLFAKYVDAAVQQALAAGFADQPVRAMAAWDAQTPGAWLRSQGASTGAAQLIALGFGTDFGSAASYLLHGLNSMGSRNRYRVEGGNDRLPEAFSRRVEVRFGVPVVAVRQDEQGVRVTAGRRGELETLQADRVICTLPCPVIGKIFQDARLSEAKQRAIRQQNYSRTVKVFLQSRTRFWIPQGLNGFVTTDLPIERLSPDPGSAASERGALTAYPIANYCSMLEKMDEEGRLAAAFEQARQIFPELSKSFEGGVSKCWGLDPWQGGSFALHTPGQIGFITILGQPEGRIHFAGEHTSAWTGWMQGALESARRVVREINS